MKTSDSYEIMNLLDEQLLIPKGDEANLYQDIILINEESAWLIRNMKENQSIGELALLMAMEYDAKVDVLEQDIREHIQRLIELGVLVE